LKKDSPGEMIFNVFNKIFMVLISFTFLFPFLNVLAYSLNNADDAIRGGIYLWPRMFTWANYRFIFMSTKDIYSAAGVSVLRTVAGVLITVFCSSMFAYVFTQPNFIFYRQLKFFFFLAMFVPTGALIPTFMLYKDLGLLNTFWVYVIPGAVGIWNTILFRTYMMGLPRGLEEAAKIDGANELMIFFRVIIPLITPIIAYVSLLVAVSQWNSWSDYLFFNIRTKALKPLQYIMIEMIKNAEQTKNNLLADRENVENLQTGITAKSIQMAITIVATVPILVVYPFLQKYFVKGIVIGSMKG